MDEYPQYTQGHANAARAGSGRAPHSWLELGQSTGNFNSAKAGSPFLVAPTPKPSKQGDRWQLACLFSGNREAHWGVNGPPIIKNKDPT